MFLTAPIWWYLLHYILVQIKAGDIQIFLFWMYVPFSIFIIILNALVLMAKESK